MVCTSFTNFKTMEKWDQMTKAANKPYYNLVCAGDYAFTYISLGCNYTYAEPVTKNNPKSIQVCSLTLQECLSRAEVQKSKKKEYGCLQGIISKHIMMQ